MSASPKITRRELFAGMAATALIGIAPSVPVRRVIRIADIREIARRHPPASQLIAEAINRRKAAA